MYKRSMNGRIYQQRTFRPKSITLNNPQQRSLQYPIKGDTSFNPQQYGKKHYLSPKHSAIHSIIFNQDYNELMKEKRELIDKINSNRNIHRFDEREGKQKIHQLNNYLNDYVIKENRANSQSNPFPPFNSFTSQLSFESADKISKGHLFRQGSMNEVLKPFSLASQRENYFVGRNHSMIEVGNKKNNRLGYADIHTKVSTDEKNLNFLPNKDFPRFINPNNLNSNF